MYQCSKCKKEFKLKSRFITHLKRKKSCLTMTSKDVVESEIDSLILYMRRLTTEELVDDKKKIQTKLQDLDLMYKNLTEEEKPAIKLIYDNELIPTLKDVNLLVE